MPNGTILNQYPEQPGTTGGIASKQLLLLDAVAGNSPGWWCPWAPFRNGSFEVTQTGTPTDTWQLWTSNAAQMPANGYTFTVNAEHTGDLCTISLTGGGFANGQLSFSYKVNAGDGGAAVAAGLLAAAQAAIKAQQQNTYPAEIATIVSQLVPSVNGAVLTIATNSPEVPYFDATAVVTGAGATTTVTTAALDTTSAGFAVSPSLSAAGNVPFMQVGTWIKANSSNWGSTGTVTAIVQGVIP